MIYKLLEVTSNWFLKDLFNLVENWENKKLCVIVEFGIPICILGTLI